MVIGYVINGNADTGCDVGRQKVVNGDIIYIVETVNTNHNAKIESNVETNIT